MNNSTVKQKMQRGGILLLASVMCFTALVGCGPKKDSSDKGGKPDTVQTDTGKKSDKKPVKKSDVTAAGQDKKAAGKKENKPLAGAADKAPVKAPEMDTAAKDKDGTAQTSPNSRDETGKKKSETDKSDKDKTKKDKTKKDKTKNDKTKKDTSKKGGAGISSGSKASAAGKAGIRNGK